MPTTLSRDRTRPVEQRLLRVVLEAAEDPENVWKVCGRRPRPDGWVPKPGFVVDQLQSVIGAYDKAHQAHLVQVCVDRLERDGLLDVRREERGEGQKAFQRISWLRLTPDGRDLAVTLPPLSEPAEPMLPPKSGPGARKHRERLERERMDAIAGEAVRNAVKGALGEALAGHKAPATGTFWVPAAPALGCGVFLVAGDGAPVNFLVDGMGGYDAS
jgi:hypothetical protein